MAEPYLRQSALRLVRLCRKRFCVGGAPDQLRVECELGPSHVTEFLTEYSASIRPAGLSPGKALPDPDPTVLRTFLWTQPVADVVLNDAVRLSLYCDQIVIVDPFSPFVKTGPFTPGPMSPHRRPELFVQQFADWALLVCALEEWIRNGLVLLIPSPNSVIRDAPPFWSMGLYAAARGLLPIQLTRETAEDMLESIALMAHNEDELAQLLSLSIPDLNVEDRLAILAALAAYRAGNPTRYNAPRRQRATLTSQGSGQNIFEAVWIADQIGGYLVPRRAQDRLLFRRFSRGEASIDSTDALATAFAAAELPMLNNVALSNALELRRSGRLSSFRSFLHEVWTATSDPDVDPKDVERDRRFVDQMKTEYATAKEEWRSIYKDLGVHGAVGIFAGGGLAQVIGGSLVPVSVGALGWIYRNWSTAARDFRRRPSGLLVQIENESNPNPLRRVLAAVEKRI